MVILRTKEIEKMNEKETNEKIKELKIELVKSRVATKKIGKLNPREIKKAIAKLETFKTKINKNKLPEGKE